MKHRIVVSEAIEERTEQLPDRWRAVHDGLGLYAYGVTAEEASKRFIQAVTFYTETLLRHFDADTVANRLRKEGLLVSMTNGTEPYTLTLRRSI